MGIPGFVHFDVSGRTHNLGLFNPMAVASIALTLAVAFLFLLVSIAGKSGLIGRKVHFSGWAWISLLIVFLTASLLEPQFVTAPRPSTDILLALFRLAQWVLGFILFWSLYSREPEEGSVNLVAGLMARICWAYILFVWWVLPIAPSFVYSGSTGGEEVVAYSRLGGDLVHPAMLTVMASIACFHALFFLSGVHQKLAVAACTITIALTYARGNQLAFLFSLAAFVWFFGGRRGKVLFAAATTLGLILSITFFSSVLAYLSRGNGVQNIITLSDRQQVWDAAVAAIQERPFLGYGFVAGVKCALKDHWKYAHWVPPHAHNDLLQAILSGGVLAGGLLLYLNGKVIWAGIAMARIDRQYGFFLFAFVQLFVFATLAPMLTNSFNMLGALFLLCSIVLLDLHRSRRHTAIAGRTGLSKGTQANQIFMQEIGLTTAIGQLRQEGCNSL